MKKVLILTGPAGSGKTTIAKIIAKKCGYSWIDGDKENSEYFPPDKQWVPELPEHSEKLGNVHNKILQKTEALVHDGNNVVVDYIIYVNHLKFFKNFKKAFGNDLEVKVLLPSLNETIRRDTERECWTTGRERIIHMRAELKKIKDTLGTQNYIDNSNQTPEETANKYFDC